MDSSAFDEVGRVIQFALHFAIFAAFAIPILVLIIIVLAIKAF